MNNIDVSSKEYLEAWNSYLYPDSDVLINKLGITNQEELSKRDAELSFERLVELYEEPIEGDFDTAHLKEIHRYIFQDVYDWAGEFRHVHIGKNNSMFASWKEIESRLDYELGLLKEELKTVNNIDMFKLLVADYFVELLNIHPFRDGNGRSTREFFREFVLKKTMDMGLGEYELDWSRVSDSELDQYLPMARFFKSPIEALIGKAIVPVDKRKNM